MNSFQDDVMQIIVEVCGEEEVRKHPDISLFENGLLDSMGIVELLVQFSDKLDIHVPITEFSREEWGTPNLIIAYLEKRRT